MEVAARHRGRASGVQIMKTAELSASECKRDQTTEYHVRPPSLLPRLWPPMPGWLRLRAPALNRRVALAQNSSISFPLPHRVLRPASKALKSSIFKASRPNTMY